MQDIIFRDKTQKMESGFCSAAAHPLLSLAASMEVFKAING
ncbi:hypothetical protein [Sediminibacillus albus]|nr:hypothetical protein [Sediminibacillus albus]